MVRIRVFRVRRVGVDKIAVLPMVRCEDGVTMKQYLWLKVSNDKYELPLAVADTARELAALCGVRLCAVNMGVYRAEKYGWESQYKRIEVDPEDNFQ